MTAPAGLDAPRIAALIDAFAARYGAAPTYVVRAPGRVNLIGEHTDYNDGFVLPVAIDREMVVVASPKADREDLEVRVWSADYAQEDRFSIGEPFVRSAEHPWIDYMRGMLHIWKACAFKLRAFEAVIAGDVPQGAGLSSSAAYEVAVGTLVNEMMATGVTPRQLATLAQKAENRFVGVQCGIMDQFISAMGRPDAALLIDCRSLDSRAVPLRLAERGLAIVIVHSGVRRGLVDSAYNERRAQCEEAVRLLSERLGRPLKALRDVSPAELKAHQKALPPLVAQRARHVVTENERVLEAVEALGAGKLEAFGKLMNGSHASLRDDFEVSCPELDALVALTQAFPGVLGARMTGAGFGGCAVALMPRDRVEAYRAEVLPAYEAETCQQATAWACEAVAGASVLDSPLRRGLG